MKLLLNKHKILALFLFIFILLFLIGCVTKKPDTSTPGKATTYPAGKTDPNIEVQIYDSEKAYKGTTLLTDRYRKPRVIEVDMQGKVIWEYVLPFPLRGYINPGFDAELLPNGNILIVLPRKGIIEIDREGKTVWTHDDPKISHDADRLSNGNTIYVFGDHDEINDAQVKEVNPKGEIVWSWRAKEHFNKPPFLDISNQGWTHTNTVIRLKNGNTLISPRNFNLLVEVDPDGEPVRLIGQNYLRHPHDPVVLDNGNILVVNQQRPHRAIEIDSKTGEVVWEFPEFDRMNSPVRDVDRLPNGNTIITGTKKIVEVTPDGKVVWELRYKKFNIRDGLERSRKGFFKAQRIPLSSL